MEGLVKLLRRMTSGRRLEAWHFRSMQKNATIARSQLLDGPYRAALVTLLVFRKALTVVPKRRSQAPGDTSQRSAAKTVQTIEADRKHGFNSWLQNSAHFVAETAF